MIAKKYYKWIAQAIKDSIMPDDNVISINNLLYNLDKLFLEDNRNFNLEEFIKDCGVELDLTDKNYKVKK
jgi:hypothetical protein